MRLERSDAKRSRKTTAPQFVMLESACQARSWPQADDPKVMALGSVGYVFSLVRVFSAKYRMLRSL